MDRPPFRVSLILLVVVFFLVFALWFTGRGEKSSMEVNLDRMEALQTKVRDFYEREGSAPETLVELKLSGDDVQLLNDSWNQPFSYSVNEGEVSIGTLGSDGKKGGAFFKGDVFKKFSLTKTEGKETKN